MLSDVLVAMFMVEICLEIVFNMFGGVVVLSMSRPRRELTQPHWAIGACQNRNPTK